MNFTVKNEKGAVVGKTYATLDEAKTFVELNDGYNKGWYIEPLNESAVDAGPKFLTEA